MHWSYAVADRTMEGGTLGNAVLSRFPLDQEVGVRLPGNLFRVRRAAAYAVLEGSHDARILAISAHYSLNGLDRQKSSSWLVAELSDLEDRPQRRTGKCGGRRNQLGVSALIGGTATARHGVSDHRLLLAKVRLQAHPEP